MHLIHGSKQQAEGYDGLAYIVEGVKETYLLWCHTPGLPFDSDPTGLGSSVRDGVNCQE